jgi:hypothetical protein
MQSAQKKVAMLGGKWKKVAMLGGKCRSSVEVLSFYHYAQPALKKVAMLGGKCRSFIILSLCAACTEKGGNAGG